LFGEVGGIHDSLCIVIANPVAIDDDQGLFIDAISDGQGYETISGRWARIAVHHIGLQDVERGLDPEQDTAGPLAQVIHPTKDRADPFLRQVPLRNLPLGFLTELNGVAYLEIPPMEPGLLD
jgi:hypothetical protein